MVSKLKIRKRFFQPPCLPPPKTEGIPKFDGGADLGIGGFSHVDQRVASPPHRTEADPRFAEVGYRVGTPWRPMEAPQGRRMGVGTPGAQGAPGGPTWPRRGSTSGPAPRRRAAGFGLHFHSP